VEVAGREGGGVGEVVDLLGCWCCGGGSVAEFAVAVVAPAFDGGVGEDGAAVCASGDGVVGGVDSDDWCWCWLVGEGSVAELSCLVVAPAFDASGLGGGAGVGAGRGEGVGWCGAVGEDIDNEVDVAAVVDADGALLGQADGGEVRAGLVGLVVDV